MQKKPKLAFTKRRGGDMLKSDGNPDFILSEVRI